MIKSGNKCPSVDMVKQVLVHLHKETQLSNKKEQTTDIRKKLDLEGIMFSGKFDLKRLYTL